MSEASAKWTRRAAFVGAGAAIIGGGYMAATRQGDHGGPHSQYFLNLSAALKRAGIAQPVIIVDIKRLQANIDAVRKLLTGTPLKLRIVVKSLPSLGLLDRIAEGLDTDRYMAFNAPMLIEMSRRKPESDLLLGKPLPVKAAEQYYQALIEQPFTEPQWLIDTEERLKQYAALAKQVNRRFRINFEIDVGLHRGGFADRASLERAVAAAGEYSQLQVSGLMGYDAHVPKMPSIESAYTKSQDLYRVAVDVLKERLPHQAFTLNAAGSPTYALHAINTVANEVSVGSAFVKPTDFDIDTLSHHAPAAFIATPVIKSLTSAQVPGLEMLTGARELHDANTARAFFIHGGHWLAKPESPPGLQYSDLYGRSSNQELLTGSESIDLQPDDFVFLRPTQSEAIFLQFGDLLAYNGKDIVDRWPTFPVSA